MAAHFDINLQKYLTGKTWKLKKKKKAGHLPDRLRSIAIEQKIGNYSPQSKSSPGVFDSPWAKDGFYILNGFLKIKRTFHALRKLYENSHCSVQT